jgi:signal transduction histidine kinase
MCLLVLFIVVLRRQVAARKRSEKALLGYQEQLTSLAAELSVAEERERRRIATVLHDTVCQTLSLSSFKLSSLSLLTVAQDTAKVLEEVKEIMDSSLDDLRALMLQLSKPIPNELNLEAALKWLSRCFYESCGLVVAIDGDNKVTLLHDETRVAIVEIVRKLLLNVVKHAQTDQSRLSLEMEDATMVIAVVDQGVGFDPRQLTTHSGDLFTIRQRISQLGGECSIYAAPGKGARIVIRVPLKE